MNQFIIQAMYSTLCWMLNPVVKNSNDGVQLPIWVTAEFSEGFETPNYVFFATSAAFNMPARKASSKKMSGRSLPEQENIDRENGK